MRGGRLRRPRRAEAADQRDLHEAAAEGRLLSGLLRARLGLEFRRPLVLAARGPAGEGQLRPGLHEDQYAVVRRRVLRRLPGRPHRLPAAVAAAPPAPPPRRRTRAPTTRASATPSWSRRAPTSAASKNRMAVLASAWKPRRMASARTAASAPTTAASTPPPKLAMNKGRLRFRSLRGTATTCVQQLAGCYERRASLGRTATTAARVGATRRSARTRACRGRAPTAKP